MALRRTVFFECPTSECCRQNPAYCVFASDTWRPCARPRQIGNPKFKLVGLGELQTPQHLKSLISICAERVWEPSNEPVHGSCQKHFRGSGAPGTARPNPSDIARRRDRSRLAFNVEELRVAVSGGALSRPWLRLAFLLSHKMLSQGNSGRRV